MPATAGLIESGHLHRMKASLPEISAVSWTDFMTGVELRDATASSASPTSSRGPTRSASPISATSRRRPSGTRSGPRAGGASSSTSRPPIPPARSSGMLVSGFVALEMAKAVYPPTYRAALERIGYQIDIDTLKARDDSGVSLAGARQDAHRPARRPSTFSGKSTGIISSSSSPGPTGSIISSGTPMRTTAHPHHTAVPRLLSPGRRAHRQGIDRLPEARRATTRASISCPTTASTGIVQEVYLNAWLEKEGFLTFAVAVPKGLEDIAPEDDGLRPRPQPDLPQPGREIPGRGPSPGRRLGSRTRSPAKLETLEYRRPEGRPQGLPGPKRSIPGPSSPQGPDLIVLGENGFDMKGSVKKKEVFGRIGASRACTPGTTPFSGPPPKKASDLAISDLATSS